MDSKTISENGEFLTSDQLNASFSPRPYILAIRKEGVYFPPPLVSPPKPQSDLECACNGILYNPSVAGYPKAPRAVYERFTGFFFGLSEKGDDVIKEELNSSRHPGVVVYALSGYQICDVRDSLTFQDLCLFYVDLRAVPNFIDRAKNIIRIWEESFASSNAPDTGRTGSRARGEGKNE